MNTIVHKGNRRTSYFSVLPHSSSNFLILPHTSPYFLTLIHAFSYFVILLGLGTLLYFSVSVLLCISLSNNSTFLFCLWVKIDGGEKDEGRSELLGISVRQ